MAKHTLDELNQLYNESEQADSELFSEMRSNVLLVAGEHYSKKGSKYWARIRDNRDLSNEQKLRLTKNHIQRIVKSYVNNIQTYCPNVKVLPNDQTELQDQKTAELDDSVWQHACTQHRLKGEKIADWLNDFVGIGEVATKIYYDPNAGDFIGMEQALDEDGNPAFDEQGQPAPSENAKFSGDLVFETLYGFNLFRHPNAKTMHESAFIGLRKMADVEELKSQTQDEEIKRKINESADETVVVFDGNTGSYKQSKGQVMLKEYYFRPCSQYPNGYFFITISDAVLFEGELPFGIMPIVFGAFEKVQTTPRGRSIVKVLRPYQAEINRTASKIAEHQITLGDDKLVMMSGSKISNGGNVPGVRAIQVTGALPTILPGRDGSQYLSYMQSQIAEMYEVAMVDEDSVEKQGQLDPYALLFRSVKQKKRFARYAERFEQFLVDVCETYLALAREYFDESKLIPIIGKREMVNISEFKNQDKLGRQIKVEPMGDDMESLMGKQLSINHALQYVGNKLEKEDIGKMMKLMPFGNFDESFSDLTIDYDSGTNILLALDRGELPQISKYDNLPYMVKRLTSRMRQPSFKQLSPQIQNNYNNLVQQYEQAITQQAQELQMAESGFIPTSGMLITCQMYVSDPSAIDPNRVKLVRLPYDALQWLVQKLKQQGQSLSQMEQMQPGVQQDMARMHASQQSQMSQPGQGQAGGMSQPGQARPGAVNNGRNDSNVHTGINGNSDAQFLPAATGAGPTGNLQQPNVSQFGH